MNGDIEHGICQICHNEADLTRKYYRYDIKCECHSPYHFELVRHCKKCIPKEPEITKIIVKTNILKKFIMDKKTGEKLIKAGREDLIKLLEIRNSGYAGILSTGEIVDRRTFPEAIPMQKNKSLGIPEPKNLICSLIN